MIFTTNGRLTCHLNSRALSGKCNRATVNSLLVGLSFHRNFKHFSVSTVELLVPSRLHPALLEQAEAKVMCRRPIGLGMMVDKQQWKDRVPCKT